MEEKLEQIKRQVTSETETTLHISRIPKKIKYGFMELANGEDFLGDYGFTLKFLMDFYTGLISNPNEQLEEKINLIAQQVEFLKNEIDLLKKQPKEEGRKMLSGKLLKRKNGVE